MVRRVLLDDLPIGEDQLRPEDQEIVEKLKSIRITIDMQNAGLNAVVDYIREISGLNFVIDDAEYVTGAILRADGFAPLPRRLDDERLARRGDRGGGKCEDALLGGEPVERAVERVAARLGSAMQRDQRLLPLLVQGSSTRRALQSGPMTCPVAVR